MRDRNTGGEKRAECRFEEEANPHKPRKNCRIRKGVVVVEKKKTIRKIKGKETKGGKARETQHKGIHLKKIVKDRERKKQNPL